ncbi:unnamed protein product (macronuclear) [Paramecium tetraurelia]|uniref:Protein kinase domain-containing protein n=1 Tax=Paramecium tetraurelia TaxID=5888 RepID=A0C5Z8_PARTE|nr:uncharacterized protein GSPATT00035344001 [Paramecium tetraurelia]CAK66215.1 unnamed protein product [Paramecium tetraurelia]|eukprot:XP_001433612.1 hypothetical protein (macronuclear) [Paramecium tetraurelia strain d4-2]
MSNFQLLKEVINFESDYSPELSRYDPKEIIGKGAFATVISAIDKVTRINVAIKIVEKSLFKCKNQEEVVRQEAIMLQSLSHQNIIKILDFYETQQKFYIVMNRIDGVTLEDYIPKLQRCEVIMITKEILKALSYLHKNNIVHRDIKPQNILIGVSEGELVVTLIDFGLSASVNRVEDSLMNKNCGTLLYQAPEVIKKANYTRSVDIWALGIVVYNMLYNGQHPFYQIGDSKAIFFEKIKNFSLNSQSNEDIYTKNFLERTIAYLPEHRLTADQCLEHPWITGKGDISIPLTLNEIIKCQVNKEQKIAKYIKMLVFLKYLVVMSNDMHGKTDEINEAGSPNDVISIIGSEGSGSSNRFRIRQLIIKSQTRLNKLWNNDRASNSFAGDTSRNATDMIPEIIQQVDSPNFAKKQLRKSNSMNPQDVMKKLRMINVSKDLGKEIQMKNRRLISNSPVNNQKLVTEPQSQRQNGDSLSKFADSPLGYRLQHFHRSNFSKKPSQL